jgi:hypothetical protein
MKEAGAPGARNCGRKASECAMPAAMGFEAHNAINGINAGNVGVWISSCMI